VADLLKELETLLEPKLKETKKLRLYNVYSNVIYKTFSLKEECSKLKTHGSLVVEEIMSFDLERESNKDAVLINFAHYETATTVMSNTFGAPFQLYVIPVSEIILIWCEKQMLISDRERNSERLREGLRKSWESPMTSSKNGNSRGSSLHMMWISRL